MSHAEQRKPKVLAVDDNAEALAALKDLLQESGYEVLTAEDGRAAFNQIESERPDLVLLDVVMPELDGYEVTRQAKADPELRYIPIILLTGKNSQEEIVFGLDQGADGYIHKPFERDELLARVQSTLRLSKLYQELRESRELNKNLTSQAVERYSYSNILGKSAAMRNVFDLIEKVADSTAPILITGESGTGKELVAKAIHFNSRRRDKAFVIQNCSAFVETLLESELFGYVKGAFTGANRDKEGLFGAAHDGTLFLDELGEMSPALQVKLLRVLQDGGYTPVGSTESRVADVRLVAATNRDLESMVRDGTFREDLFYRVSVINIQLPSLRDRRDDIPLLVESFLSSYAEKNHL
ncbi:MAG: sigma-54-dependent Fis family transcriptional regulator, partial [Bdellovibrionales bacterium]|nr:sigma-54-dependent Fis family transcriptional regulator [Bdellovibrionales bacterium]